MTGHCRLVAPTDNERPLHCRVNKIPIIVGILGYWPSSELQSLPAPTEPAVMGRHRSPVLWYWSLEVARWEEVTKPMMHSWIPHNLTEVFLAPSSPHPSFFVIRSKLFVLHLEQSSWFDLTVFFGARTCLEMPQTWVDWTSIWAKTTYTRFLKFTASFRLRTFPLVLAGIFLV